MRGLDWRLRMGEGRASGVSQGRGPRDGPAGKAGEDDCKRHGKAQRDEIHRNGAHLASGPTRAWASLNAHIFWRQRAGAMGGGTEAAEGDARWGAALGRAVMQLTSCQGRDGHPVLWGSPRSEYEDRKNKRPFQALIEIPTAQLNRIVNKCMRCHLAPTSLEEKIRQPFMQRGDDAHQNRREPINHHPHPKSVVVVSNAKRLKLCPNPTAIEHWLRDKT
jgi:hypothetical protein